MSYLAMQKLYETQAQKHYALFKTEVLEVLHERGIPPTSLAEAAASRAVRSG